MTPQMYTLFLKTRSFFGHHHPTIFFSIVGLLLAFAIYTLTTITSSSATGSSQTTDTIGQFDQETVNKIKELQDSNNGDKDTTFALPSKRPNPFSE